MKIYIRGGIGDFLQCIPYATGVADKEFIIHTHYPKAKEFFDHFGIKNTKVFYFQNAQQHDEQVDEIMSLRDPKISTNFKECPRTFYFKLDFNSEDEKRSFDLVNSFSKINPIIGIHPFGSDFSRNIYSKFNLPTKFIPSDLIEKLINENPNNNYLIFGSKKDFSDYGLKESENIKFVCFDDISTSLTCVKRCDKFLGTDSCFKTMSSSHGIKTYCIVGNFDDQTRDYYFLNQYVGDEIMKIFKFDNVENQRQEIIDFFAKSINE